MSFHRMHWNINKEEHFWWLACICMWVVLGFCLLKVHGQVRVVKWKRETREAVGCVKDGILISVCSIITKECEKNCFISPIYPLILFLFIGGGLGYYFQLLLRSSYYKTREVTV